MPELPEVETVRRTLENLVLGKTIEKVSVRLPRIVQQPQDLEQFAMQLQGTTITQIGRRGKFLKFFCEPWVLVSHLRMEGKYRVQKKEDPLEKHTHVIFHFTDDEELRYLDVRQFGTMHLFTAGQEDQLLPLKKLGVEPLSTGFNAILFQQQLSMKQTKIKPLLLNQECVVGLGNIYVDEALFLAGIHPERRANTLFPEEVVRLYQKIRDVLSKAVDAGGSSIRSYVDGKGDMGLFQQQLQVYGRKEEPCYQCTSPIERIVVGGRGTHICVSCQPI